VARINQNLKKNSSAYYLPVRWNGFCKLVIPAQITNINGGIVMAEKRIGEVVKFFSKPSVAAVKIVEGDVVVGDSLKFSGHTTDFIDVINSMEVDNKSVQKAIAGDFIGLKVSNRVRPGDEVFKVIPD
jgi:putative protease